MFEILGYIFVTILCFYLLVNIILIGINFFKDCDDDKYRHIVCETSFYTWSISLEGLYIIPGVSIHKDQRITLQIEWLCFQYNIQWYVKTDEEDDAEYRAVRDLRNES